MHITLFVELSFRIHFEPMWSFIAHTHSLLTQSRYAVTHYDDVIMGAMASQITSITIVYSTVYSGADQRKYQSSASLAFVQGIHLGPVNSPHKWPVTQKMFPFDDVIIFGKKLHTIRSISRPWNREVGCLGADSLIRFAHFSLSYCDRCRFILDIDSLKYYTTVRTDHSVSKVFCVFDLDLTGEPT